MPEQHCLHCGAVAYSLECAGWCRLCGAAEVVTPAHLQGDSDQTQEDCGLLACGEG